jgi:hypothetical protein
MSTERSSAIMPPAASAGFHAGRRSLTNHFAQWVILAWCGIGIAQLVTNQLPQIFLHESIGNGDSYIFMAVEDFRKTGVLYPQLGPDHLTPVLYSPFLYLMHDAAWMAMPWPGNPYFGPRLLELFCFLTCIAVTGALTRRLIPVRSAFWLGVLLASSYFIVIFWVLQLRSDFPGIGCSLLTLWLLISPGRRSALYAGACAGLALQFKITFVTAAAAGFLWLLLYRRWRALCEFTCAAGVFSLGLYAAFAWREPEMLKHILMMRKMIPHPSGVITFWRDLAAEPAFLLGFVGLLPMASGLLTRRRPHLQLVMMFVVISFLVGSYTSLQTGANINYFYEAAFAITPFAVLAFLRLDGARSRTAGLLIGLVFLITNVLPGIVHTIRGARANLTEISRRNSDYEKLRQALDGTRIVSSIPDVTILRPERVITDSNLLNNLSIIRGVDLSRVIARIDEGYFDVVVTQPADYSWRGLPVLQRGLRTAIIGSYSPYCLFGNKLFHLPKEHPSLLLESKLRDIGCETVQCGPGLKCPGLGVAIEAFSP